MRRLHLNADIGERGGDHPVDSALLDLVDLVNIACGGHAGDATSATTWAERARAAGIACSLHPSYPDREGFGRRSRFCDWDRLASSLDHQRACLPTIDQVKFHGALYNDAAGDAELAGRLVAWCRRVGLRLLVAPPGSALAGAGQAGGLDLMLEGFADRGYRLTASGPALKPRGEPGALLDDPVAVVAQVAGVVETGALVIDDRAEPFHCDTWCLHSDTPGALANARALRAWETRC